MGLFDGISRNPVKSVDDLDLQHAMVIIMLLGMYSDKVDRGIELLIIKQLLCKSPIFAENTDKKDDVLVEQCKRYIHAHPDALDQACSVIPCHLRLTAFAMAVEVVFADQVIDPLEAAFTQKLSDKLGIDPERSRSIIETFDILYTGE